MNGPFERRPEARVCILGTGHLPDVLVDVVVGYWRDDEYYEHCRRQIEIIPNIGWVVNKLSAPWAAGRAMVKHVSGHMTNRLSYFVVMDGDVARQYRMVDGYATAEWPPQGLTIEQDVKWIVVPRLGLKD
jgi:hypothetical protein